MSSHEKFKIEKPQNFMAANVSCLTVATVTAPGRKKMNAEQCKRNGDFVCSVPPYVSLMVGCLAARNMAEIPRLP